MKKIFVVVLAAGALALTGCGPKEPAPTGSEGDWSKQDDVGVLINTLVPGGDVVVTVKNERGRGDISSDDVLIEDIDGDHVRDHMVDDFTSTFDSEFTQDVAPGKSVNVTVPVLDPLALDGATVTVSVDGQAFPITLID